MNSLGILFVILVILLIAVSGKAGLRNLLGVFLNFAILWIMVLLIGWGINALVLLPVMSLLILAIAIFMSSDESEITGVAFKSSVIVVLFLLVLAILLQYLGQFQGFAAEDVDSLEELSLNIGLNFSNIAVVVMVISMLGAVAEAAMALTEALHEIIEQDEQMTVVQFNNQRKIISQQILGTAVNTLFFGVLGSSIGLILWFVRLHYSLAEILNSKLLMGDAAAMLLGLLGILLVIWLSGYFVQKEFENEK
jgi:uncharacterized membrane protein